VKMDGNGRWRLSGVATAAPRNHTILHVTAGRSMDASAPGVRRRSVRSIGRVRGAPKASMILSCVGPRNQPAGLVI
jgi:hypothetical protein